MPLKIQAGAFRSFNPILHMRAYNRNRQIFDSMNSLIEIRHCVGKVAQIEPANAAVIIELGVVLLSSIAL